VKLSTTIITPAFQASSCIQQCLESVASQISQRANPSEAAIEHLIIDGASTDGTVEIANKFAAQHRHVRVISEPDSGQSNAMNKGIHLAQGEIIGFLNADDAHLPGAVVEAHDILKTLPEPAFVCGNCRVVDAEGQVIHLNKPKRLGLIDLFAGAEPPWNPAAYFYHKSLHDLIGFYDENDHYTMDLDFILRAAAEIKLHYVDRDWGVFLWAAGGKTFDAQQVNTMETRKLAVIERHLERLPGPQRLMVKTRRQIGWFGSRLKQKLKRSFSR